MGLILALVFGLLLRLAPIVITDFPLGDGGLFASMALDIRAAGFALPEHASYNGGGIPFMYPPLGLYVLAAVPGDPISTLRWLPLFWSLVAIAAGWLLVRELTDDVTASVAAVAFAAMPLAWAIEGGGATRALGLALLYLALWAVLWTFRRGTLWAALLAGVLGGLALLSHPAVAPAGIGSAVLFLAFRFSRRNALLLLGAGLVAAAVVAPWFLTVTARHGFDALAAGFGSHDEESIVTRLFVYGPTWIGPMDLVIGAALVGAAVCIARRQWLPLAWLLVLLVVPGGGGRYATLVWALLAAIGVLAIRPALTAQGAARYAMVGAAGLLFIAALIAGYQRFQAIPGPVRERMAQVREETPASATFAVRVDAGSLEPVIEWFPMLAERRSVGSYMGLEWSPDAWEEARLVNAAIQAGGVPPSASHLFVVEDGLAVYEPAQP